jgi:protein-disulfide isomerase
MSETKEQRLQVPISENDHIRGPVGAPVTVVKYGDFECPDCHRAHKTIRAIIRPVENKIRFVYRHFPLMHIHPRALRAAEASEAAATQGKFWEMYELLFLNPNKLEDKHLRGHAKDIRLDLGQFDRELNEGIYVEKIRKSYQQSLIYGITGTPTFYINDTRYNDSDIERMVDYIKTIIKAAEI